MRSRRPIRLSNDQHVISLSQPLTPPVKPDPVPAVPDSAGHYSPTMFSKQHATSSSAIAKSTQTLTASIQEAVKKAWADKAKKPDSSVEAQTDKHGAASLQSYLQLVQEYNQAMGVDLGDKITDIHKQVLDTLNAGGPYPGQITKSSPPVTTPHNKTPEIYVYSVKKKIVTAPPVSGAAAPALTMLVPVSVTGKLAYPDVLVNPEMLATMGILTIAVEDGVHLEVNRWIGPHGKLQGMTINFYGRHKHELKNLPINTPLVYFEDGGHTLRVVFDTLMPHGYRVGKLE